MATLEESRVARLAKERRTGPEGKPSSQKSPWRAVVGSRPGVGPYRQPDQYDSTMERMASLVADYGTSSGSEDEASESESSKDEVEEEETTKNGNDDNQKDTASSKKLPLPTPDFNSTPAMKTSVFINPFVEAEKAKSAILEKHVKMTPTLDDTKMINGRKICWNYRKGRCRFGHNCTFAHDSDLHRSAAELEALRAPQETVICQTQYNGQIGTNDEEEVDQENNQTHKRKKRPGLSQTLVPGKKVIKMYKAQQAKAISR